MKILHIAPTPFFSDRGCHMRILTEIRGLQARNHEVILTTYHNGKDVPCLRIERIINIPWYNKTEAGASWHKLYLDMLLIGITMKVCFREKPDILHGHLHEGALIGKVVGLFFSERRIPVVFDAQGSLTGELQTYGFFKSFPLLKAAFEWIEKVICRLPDHFVCSSESNAQFLRNEMGVPDHKITPVPDSIDPDFFKRKENGSIRKRLGIPSEKKIVIYTGSLMESKGIDYLLDAIPQVIHDFNAVHFLIIGYPVLPSSTRIKEMNLENRVSFAGKVDFFELSKYLALADAAVDPKVDEAGEGSGKIINYMGMGLPIVCFEGLNNRILLGESGVYARPGDSEDLAGKIVELLRNEILAKRTGEENRKRAQDLFSWEAGGQKLSQIYMKVIHRE